MRPAYLDVCCCCLKIPISLHSLGRGGHPASENVIADGKTCNHIAASTFDFRVVGSHLLLHRYEPVVRVPDLPDAAAPVEVLVANIQRPQRAGRLSNQAAAPRRVVPRSPQAPQARRAPVRRQRDLTVIERRKAEGISTGSGNDGGWSLLKCGFQQLRDGLRSKKSRSYCESSQNANA